MSHFFSLLSSSQGAEVFFKSSCVKRRVGCNFQLWRSVPWTSAFSHKCFSPRRKPSCFPLNPGWLIGILINGFLESLYGCFRKWSTPKSSLLIRFSIINHPFWGTPFFFWKHPYNYCSIIPPYISPNQPVFFSSWLSWDFFEGLNLTTSGLSLTNQRWP